MPPGNSAVEVAARGGFGPLSPLVSQAWHGNARPCVSCGQLVRRNAVTCGSCGEDLSDVMIEKMRAHAGPWYVLEHVRPFPGVTFERLVRQIRRGVLTRTTILRGPATDHQWQFAGETPGVSKYLGVCWNCQASVSEAQAACPLCRTDLGVLNDLPGAGARSGGSSRSPVAESAALRELAAVASSVPERTEPEDDYTRIGALKVWWIIAAMLIVVMGVLFAVV